MREQPMRVVLPGRGTDERPAVRLFVGTEPGQERAERVWLWSLARVRDPARRYEVSFLKNLAGFRNPTGLWKRREATGFTRYRFAVPHFAGGRGRALYHDVDQIFLADPAELFDLPLLDCGYSAVAPNDLSVMLLDAERMVRVWPLDEVHSRSRRALEAQAAAKPGLFGPLDPAWNVRDGGAKDAAADAKLLHFTTLHTQPWRPFPDRFAYLPHPRAAQWEALEREAIEARFHVWNQAQPSDGYADWWVQQAPWIQATRDGFLPPTPETPPPTPVPRVHADGWIAGVPDDDLPWILDALCASATESVQLEMRSGGHGRERDRWETRLREATRAHPRLAWELVWGAARSRGGRWRRSHPPRVWLLLDDRPGNATQARGLAEALGWPSEEKPLGFGAAARMHNRFLGASLAGLDAASAQTLTPPWPDLVIAAGRRTAPVAQWIRRQSGGHSRVVVLGRKGGDDLRDIDWAVAPRYTRLLPDAGRIETEGPLHRITPARLARAESEWADALAKAQSPKIAVLVGGPSGQFRLDADVARRLGEECARLAADTGGSLFVTTSRRLAERAAHALLEGLGEVTWFHRWRPHARSNPYLGYLAHADACVVTGDSESMLAEATSLGRPVLVYELPERRSFRILGGPREWIWRGAHASPLGSRGTPRPQPSWARLCARAIDRGLVRPPRDLRRYHAALYASGRARPFHAGLPSAAEVPLPGCIDRERVAEEIAARMGVARGVEAPSSS
ncbi:MAG: mitochondrial fission ELM1 family protein [Myxococcota bacterium]